VPAMTDNTALIEEVLKLQYLSSSSKFILLVMAFHSNEKKCQLSLNQLIEITCLNRKTILSGIKKLVDEKLIYKTGEKFGKTLSKHEYKINLLNENEPSLKKYKSKTFAGMVYEDVQNQFKLKGNKAYVFFRLLGFLLKEDEPFKFSINALSKLTGASQSSIYEAINGLEKLKLIQRAGFTSNVKFTKGLELEKIINDALHAIDVENQLLMEQANTKSLAIQARREQFNKKRAQLFLALLERDGNSCSYCKNKGMLEVDHVLPLSKGGTDDIHNLQLLCKKCNLDKSDKF